MSDQPPPPAAKPKKTPRPAWTYRAARKADARRERRQMLRHAPEVIDTVAPSAELNRSWNWPRAMTYGYARELSKSTEPVR